MPSGQNYKKKMSKRNIFFIFICTREASMPYNSIFPFFFKNSEQEFLKKNKAYARNLGVQLSCTFRILFYFLILKNLKKKFCWDKILEAVPPPIKRM